MYSRILKVQGLAAVAALLVLFSSACEAYSTDVSGYLKVQYKSAVVEDEEDEDIFLDGLTSELRIKLDTRQGQTDRLTATGTVKLVNGVPSRTVLESAYRTAFGDMSLNAGITTRDTWASSKDANHHTTMALGLEYPRRSSALTASGKWSCDTMVYPENPSRDYTERRRQLKAVWTVREGISAQAGLDMADKVMPGNVKWSSSEALGHISFAWRPHAGTRVVVKGSVKAKDYPNYTDNTYTEADLGVDIRYKRDGPNLYEVGASMKRKSFPERLDKDRRVCSATAQWMHRVDKNLVLTVEAQGKHESHPTEQSYRALSGKAGVNATFSPSRETTLRARVVSLASHKSHWSGKIESSISISHSISRQATASASLKHVMSWDTRPSGPAVESGRPVIEAAVRIGF